MEVAKLSRERTNERQHALVAVTTLLQEIGSLSNFWTVLLDFLFQNIHTQNVKRLNSTNYCYTFKRLNQRRRLGATEGHAGRDDRGQYHFCISLTFSDPTYTFAARGRCKFGENASRA